MNTTQTWKIGNCLDLLPSIETGSIDMILTDMPYGKTACAWDTIIPIEPLWTEYKRIIKDKGVIVLTATQPFASILIMGNLNMFRYELIWEKGRAFGFLHSKNKPLMAHENIIIFSTGVVAHKTLSRNRMCYNPQMGSGKPYTRKHIDVTVGALNHKASPANIAFVGATSKSDGERYPRSVLRFKNHNIGNAHPTQKPIALFEYLIKTYTDEGDWVHDSCLGGGTTLEACRNTNRNCIGFEISDEWEHLYADKCR